MDKVFLDSDVIISSLISSAGASYQLINQKKTLKYISSHSYTELLLVIKKLDLNKEKFIAQVKEKLIITKLKKNLKEIQKSYNKYVNDVNDAHIVAGAIESGERFLITYNIKHFQKNKIKEDFNIQIMSPGNYLQYLRSRK